MVSILIFIYSNCPALLSSGDLLGLKMENSDLLGNLHDFFVQPDKENIM